MPNRRANANTRTGFLAAFYRSIIAGFALTLFLEFTLGGPGAAGMAPEFVLGVPTGVGLLCGIGMVGIQRRWGTPGVIVAGWSTALTMVGFLGTAILCLSMNGIPFLNVFGAPAMPISFLGGLLGGFLGFWLGLRRLSEGKLDVPV